MYAACPSSVVIVAALKILRCAQDDRSGVGRGVLGAVPDGGHPLSVAFRRQLPQRGSHEWCGATERGVIKTVARFTSQSAYGCHLPSRGG